MAGNSASAKTWCIALVSAILVVVADRGTPSLIWIALMPIGLFLILDAYYLGLERIFRGHYNSFIEKLHQGSIETSDIYVVTPSESSGATLGSTFNAARSFSIWPFYTVQIVVLMAARAFLGSS